MRILAVTPLYPPHSLVGAWMTTHEFLAHAAARGHDVDVIAHLAPTHREPYTLDRVLVHSKSRTMDRLFDRADVVVCHAGDSSLMAPQFAARRGLPVVTMAHSVITGRRLTGSSLVVFNSHSLARTVRWAGSSVVCRPPVFADRYRTTPGDRVTLVNLSAAKGASMFYRLARDLPDVEFLGVKGGHGTQVVKDFPNVEIIDTQADMREAYGRTRVLLCPSSRETWGRVGIEAACSGIPTIATPTPGLRESLGDAGTFVARNLPKQWAAAVERLSDPDEWAAASQRALARAAELDPADDLDRFVEAVEGVSACRIAC